MNAPVGFGENIACTLEFFNSDFADKKPLEQSGAAGTDELARAFEDAEPRRVCGDAELCRAWDDVELLLDADTPPSTAAGVLAHTSAFDSESCLRPPIDMAFDDFAVERRFGGESSTSDMASLAQAPLALALDTRLFGFLGLF